MMQTFKQILALAALLPLIIASPIPQSTSNNAVEQLADSLENVAGSAVNNLNQNGDGNQAGNGNKNNGNGNGVGAGAGNGNGNNFGNGNNIGAGNNGINLGSRQTSSNPIDSMSEELQNVAGSVVGNLGGNGDNNQAGNGNEGNGNENGDGAGTSNGNKNIFGNGNNIGAGNNGINLGSRQETSSNPLESFGEELENVAGSTVGNLDQNGNNNQAGNGNKDNGNGNGDGAGANNGNGNTFGNGNNIGSNNNGINLRKVRRNPQGDDTANYINGVLTASTEGIEGVVDAALPESGGPAETIENAAGNAVQNLNGNGDGNSAGNGNTDNGNNNGDGAGANNGDGNTFGNDNNILSNNGGIDVDPTINLRSIRWLARRLPLFSS